jgi:hypothetical protein
LEEELAKEVTVTGVRNHIRFQHRVKIVLSKHVNSLQGAKSVNNAARCHPYAMCTHEVTKL